MQYAMSKGIGMLYLGAWARRNAMNDTYKVLSVSPGGTTGTKVLNQKAVPWIVRLVMTVVWKLMEWLGRFQSLEKGAKKYVDVMTGEQFADAPNGTFLGCETDLAGPLCDQALLGPGASQFYDEKKQEAAFEALQAYMH
ncbi:MAG: hypothetical protein SGARI_007473 [Bacillariaceae sp.]